MGQFFIAWWTSLASPWSFQAVQMAYHNSLSVCMGNFSSIDGTSPDSPWSIELILPFSTDKTDHISLLVCMGRFFIAWWTNLDSPWSFQVVWMADRISLLVRMGHFSCTDGTSLDSPWSIELNPSIQYICIDFSWPDEPLWTVLGQPKQYGWLIYVWVIFDVLMEPVLTVHSLLS